MVAHGFSVCSLHVSCLKPLHYALTLERWRRTVCSWCCLLALYCYYLNLCVHGYLLHKIFGITRLSCTPSSGPTLDVARLHLARLAPCQLMPSFRPSFEIKLSDRCCSRPLSRAGSALSLQHTIRTLPRGVGCKLPAPYTAPHTSADHVVKQEILVSLCHLYAPACFLSSCVL